VAFSERFYSLTCFHLRIFWRFDLDRH